MKNFLLLLPFLGLWGCEQTEKPTDVAARASGRFAVQSYVVNGDTLYTSRGVNKIGVSEFYIIVDRKKPDSVRVGSVYKQTGAAGSFTHIKDVGVSETSVGFQLSAQTGAVSIYECRIEGNTFYERAVRGGPGVLVVPPSYVFKRPTDPALEGIVITAQR